MKRASFFLVDVLACCIFAFAGPASPQQPITVEQIFHQDRLQVRPPENLTWSPDGVRLIYLRNDGSLMEVQGATGSQKVLIGRDKMRVFTETVISERDRAARERYHQSIYSWAPDSKHLLFDAGGQLWLFDTVTGTGLQLVATGAGSGDDPQFSPDGSSLSYLHDHNLYVDKLREAGVMVKLTDSSSASVTNGAVDWLYEEELDVRSNYFWAPDSKHIAYLQMNETDVPQYPIVDWIPMHATVDRQSYPQPGDPNPAVRVGVVSANGGKTKWINVPMDSGNDYIPRLGLAEQQDRLGRDADPRSYEDRALLRGYLDGWCRGSADQER